MGVIRRNVRGILYEYYRDKDRHETLLGKAGSPEAKDRLREVMRAELQSKIVSLGNELLDIDAAIKEKEEAAEFEEAEAESFAYEKMEDWRVPSEQPYYTTPYGVAYLGDSLQLMKKLPEKSVSLICTSPPFALVRKKQYGNEDAANYVEWFRPFAKQMHRILTDDGSLVIHMGGAWNEGEPTKSLYTYQFLLALCSGYEDKFKLAQDFFWYNPAKLPSPAEWVNVRRVRVKDAVDFVWWLSKGSEPKADNRRVLKVYSKSMKNLLRNGYKAKLRPSGHNISTKFRKDLGGSIPSNLLFPSDILAFSNTESMGDYQTKCREFGLPIHPARYPNDIPEFFIRFLTENDSTILDPFGGSNVTGSVAESMGRRWMSIEIQEEYIKGSMFRFKPEQLLTGKVHIAHLKPVPA